MFKSFSKIKRMVCLKNWDGVVRHHAEYDVVRVWAVRSSYTAYVNRPDDESTIQVGELSPTRRWPDQPDDQSLLGTGWITRPRVQWEGWGIRSGRAQQFFTEGNMLTPICLAWPLAPIMAHTRLIAWCSCKDKNVHVRKDLVCQRGTDLVNPCGAIACDVRTTT